MGPAALLFAKLDTISLRQEEDPIKMSDYLVTYDLKEGVPDPHKPFLTAAEPRGWLYVLEAGTDMFRLPNTTLWGVFKNRDAARAAFDAALADAEKAIGKSIALEKRLISKLDDFFVRSDKRKPADPKLTASTTLGRCRNHQLRDKFFA
jgi:hypothetical protein